MLPLMLLFVLALSGVVAYTADVVARKVGRKHLRMFGLRPKDTALLVAVFSGMAISLISLGAFVLLNRDAVATIQRAGQLRPQLEGLQREVQVQNERLQGLNNRLQHAERLSEQATLEAQQAQEKRRQAEDDLQLTQNELIHSRRKGRELSELASRLDGRVKGLEDRKKTLEGEAAQRRLQLQQNRELLAASAAQLSDSKRSLASQGALLQAAKAELAARQSEAAALRSRSKGLQLAVQDTNRQLSTLQRQASARAAEAERQSKAAENLESSLQLLEQARQDALAHNAEIAENLRHLQAKNEQAEARRRELEGDIVRLEEMSQRLLDQQAEMITANASLTSDLASTRSNLSLLQNAFSSTQNELRAAQELGVIFSKGDVVHFAVVRDLRDVSQFAADARRKATARGASGTTGAEESLAQGLRLLPSGGFAQCRTTSNVLQDQLATLRCTLRPDNVLWPAGAVVASRQIRPSKTAAAGSEALQPLLEEAKNILLERGIPTENVPPQLLDFESSVELLAALLTLGEEDAPMVNVQIKAQEDIRAGEPVRLKAEIEQAKTPGPMR